MTIRAACKKAITSLNQAKIASANLDTELIMAHVLGRDRTWVLAHDDTELDEPQIEQFDALINRRLNHEPLVHLTGTREFYGLEFEITPDVLTPRTETEQMVEWAVNYTPQGSQLLDIGTGSGAIAIAIAHQRPDLHITATDLSERELTIARRNATLHHAAIEFVVSNLFKNIPAPTTANDHFATIVTNLPYLREDARADLMPEVKHEPAVALFGGADGLDLYRRLLSLILTYLAPGGYLFTESDPWQHEALVAEAAKYNLKPIEQGYFILGFQLTSKR
jgi:release factor glutamine methyltransferase